MLPNTMVITLTAVPFAMSRGNVEFMAVVDGALAHPGVENCLDGDFQLFENVIRKGATGFLAHHVQKDFADFAQVVRAQPDVDLDALALLEFLERLVEFLVGDAERHLAEQLDETPVGIVAKALVVRLPDQSCKGVRVQAEVENGVHHAGHGERRAGTDRQQQGVVGITEALAGAFFQLADLRAHAFEQAVGNGAFG